MAPLIIFIVLFLCGLINSYFFPPKLFSSLRSLLISIFPSKKKQLATSTKNTNDIKKETDELVSSELETIFSTFDGDGDGFITAEELMDSLERLRLAATKDEIRSMMERVDANRDGLIDLGEFRELYESLCGGSGREEQLGGGGDGDMDLREAFEVFDGNRDGVITVEELGEVLRSIGLKQGAEVQDLREMIRRVDLDGDGMVDFEEFKKMMMVKSGKLF